MGGRRTRKDKETARHTFLMSWENEPKKSRFEASVKPQFKKPFEAKKASLSNDEKPKNMTKDDNLASVKHDIGKSLIIASLIFGVELVIYLAWF